MIHQIFSIYDNKAEAYFPPFFLPNKSMAIRQFGDMVTDDKYQTSKHPEDYTLFHLGSWNDISSEHDLNKSVKSLGNGVEFLYNQNNVETIPQIEPDIKKIA